MIQADVISPGTTGTTTQWSISARETHARGNVIQYSCWCTLNMSEMNMIQMLGLEVCVHSITKA